MPVVVVSVDTFDDCRGRWFDAGIELSREALTAAAPDSALVSR
jgi:hypothetical protein